MNEIVETATDGIATPATEPPAATEADAAGSFLDSFEETDRGFLEVKGWDSPGKILEGYRNLEKAYGNPNKMVLPSDQSSPEEVNEFWTALGKPADPGEYNLQAPENFEAYNSDLSDGFRNKAHELNLPASTAQALHDWFVEQQMGDFNAAQANASDKLAAQDKAARAEFGAEYDEMLKMAGVATSHPLFNRPGFQELVEAQGLQNHPEFVAVFGKLGKLLSEPNTDGTGLGQSGGEVQMSVSAQIEAKKQDPDFLKAYTTREHMGHEAAVREMDALYTRLAEETMNNG